LIDEVSNLEMEDAFVQHTNWDLKGKPYVIACSEKIRKELKVTKCTKESQQLLEVLRTTRTYCV
jgi:uridine phosphorylase